MKTQTWTVFDATTRVPVTSVTCSEDALAKRLKDGQIAIEGRHRGTVRLNNDGKVEADTERAETDLRERKKAARQSQIEALERKQTRILRELVIDPTVVGEDGKTPTQRLQALDQEIAALRADRPT